MGVRIFVLRTEQSNFSVFEQKVSNSIFRGLFDRNATAKSIEIYNSQSNSHSLLQNLSVMQKMSYFSPLLFLALDVCVVHAVRLAQSSPLLLPHPFIILWGGGLVRACVLLLLSLTHTGSLPWMRSSQGLHTVGVLCLHVPVYTSLLWALGWPVLEDLWGWHSWERVGGRVFNKTLI